MKLSKVMVAGMVSGAGLLMFLGMSNVAGLVFMVGGGLYLWDRYGAE